MNINEENLLYKIVARVVVDNANGSDIDVVENSVIILPTRRSVRSCAEVYFNLQDKGDAVALPKIITFSEIPDNLNLFSLPFHQVDTVINHEIDPINLEFVLHLIAEEAKRSFPENVLLHSGNVAEKINDFIVKFYTFNADYESIREHDILSFIIYKLEEKLVHINQILPQQRRNIAVERIIKYSSNSNVKRRFYVYDYSHNALYIRKFLKFIKRTPNTIFFSPLINFTKELKVNLIETENIFQEAQQIALGVAKSLIADPLCEKSVLIINNNTLLNPLIKLELKKYQIEIDDSTPNSAFKQKEIKFFCLLMQIIALEQIDRHSFLTILTYIANLRNDHDLMNEIYNFSINYLNKLKQKIDLKALDLTAYQNIEIIVKNLISAKYEIYKTEDCVNFFDVVLRLAAGFYNDNFDNNAKLYLEDIRTRLSLYGINRYRLSLLTYRDIIIKILLKFPLNQDIGKRVNTVKILPLLETKLLDFDVVFLASFNEGNIPQQPTDCDLIDSALARKLNFPDNVYEEQFGDLINIIINSEVTITRSKHEGSRKTTASRFLQMLNISFNSIFYEILNKKLYPKVQVMQLPLPKPGSCFRPSSYSVSAIEKLINNPYVYYATYILKLKPLKERNSRADFGIFIHQTITAAIVEAHFLCKENFVKRFLEVFKQNITKEYYDDKWLVSVWNKRAMKIANWLFLYENQIKDKIIKSSFEKSCSKKIFIEQLHREVEITAIADRLIEFSDNDCLIIDYKTGYIPTQSEINKGIRPQLAVEHLLIAPEAKNVRQVYIELKGKDEGGDIRQVKVDTKEAEQGLESLLSTFLNEKYCYFPSLDRIGYYLEFAHLIRVLE